MGTQEPAPGSIQSSSAEPAKPSVLKPWRSNKLLVLALFSLLASTFAGLWFPLSPAETQVMNDLFLGVMKEGPVAILTLILLTNLRALVLMHVPVLGAVLAVSGTFVSGSYLGGVADSVGLNPIVPFLLTFVLPHGILEFLAYAMAEVQSLLSARLLLRRRFTEALRSFLYSLAISAAVLLLAGIVETVESALLANFPA